MVTSGFLAVPMTSDPAPAPVSRAAMPAKPMPSAAAP